ncbi:MerR family transcriptional regulator [Amycolatopsis sp. NPDC005232]|uniref:helix-turn-helix domain-containing protein n=1 Tax=Amycolatopsis sp. NPDC005232 TaxID=3157027 RepID=UPI0033A7F103
MWSIGETAAKLGVAVSALRCCDERGLVRPATRRSGKCLYGEAELHRLTIVKMLQDTGLLSLDDIALIIGGPEAGDWRAAIRVRIEEIVEQRRKLAVAETWPSQRGYTDRVLNEEK